MNTPLYRIIGWNRSHGDRLGSCIFGIELDAEFAKKCLEYVAPKEYGSTQQVITRFIDDCKFSIQDKDIRVSLLNNSFLPGYMSVSGNCCCIGIDGNDHDPKHWGKTLRYHGHNIDSRPQAYDLLSLFCQWVDVAEAIVTPTIFN